MRGHVIVSSPEASVLLLVLAVHKSCLISSTVDILQGEISVDQAKLRLSCCRLKCFWLLQELKTCKCSSVCPMKRVLVLRTSQYSSFFLRSVSGWSQVSLKSVSSQSQVSLRSVSGLSVPTSSDRRSLKYFILFRETMSKCI